MKNFLGAIRGARVLSVEREDDARLLPDHSVDGFEARANHFEGEHFAESEV